MQGRLEHELKQEKMINAKLNIMPEFVTEWYLNLKASQRTAATCYDYIIKIYNYLYFINPNVKTVKYSDISLSKTQQYFISIQTKNVKGNTVYTSDSYQQTVWCCLNNFLHYLYKTNKITSNYMEMISKPKNNDLERINQHRILLTRDDFNKIINVVKCGVATKIDKSYLFNMKNRDLLIMYLFMTTGIRKTALSEINISDIDFDEEVLYVIDKGNKRHSYPLSNVVMEALYDWLDDRDNLDIQNENALFVSLTGNRLTSTAIYNIVDKYSKEALGYHISPHKLRSGFCSILYDETRDTEFVRRAVGHSNIATTQRYIVTDNNERTKASEIISNIF